MGNIISEDEYKEKVRQERVVWFKTPYDLVYDNFIKNGYDKKDASYFLQNASSVVEQLRADCWEEFQESEKEFTAKMLKILIDSKTVEDMTPSEAIEWFASTYPSHIYNLNLSNTQSRRSRAGKEFESIIELLLIAANIPMDSQGNIGKACFVNKGLGKLVDAVSPGVVQFAINKRNTVLISAKTTLRERWQEVPEEMGRTGAREMFLATLDENISKEVLDTLYEANIQVTTTRRIKNEYYSTNDRVLDFEGLLQICSNNHTHWIEYNYSEEQGQEILSSLQTQIAKHDNHDYIQKAFINRMENYVKVFAGLGWGKE